MASRKNASTGRARRRVLSTLSVVFAALAMAWGCASQKGDGSESHFVNCSTDATCAERGLGKCVSGKCEGTTPSTDGSVAPPDATSAEGSPSQCVPPDPFYCVDECGHDFLIAPSCANGVWKCPSNAPFRDDECPFICGGGAPLPPCCGTYGQEPRVCPDGAQAICPPGTFEYRDGNCPTDCAVADPKLPVPYQMTFRFTNASGRKVAVWNGCAYEFELAPCASGYTVPVDTFAFCSPICPETQQQTCGACNNEPAPVSSSAPLEMNWDGYTYSSGSFAGRPCAEPTTLAATRYRIRVPVYSDSPPTLPGGGFEKVPLYTVSVDFTTSPNGVVEIPIDQGP